VLDPGSSSPPPAVFVSGATGYIGGRLVPRLLERGYRVRCHARSPRKLEDRPWAADPRVEIVSGDLADEAALATSMGGCATAFYLVHSMLAAGGDYAKRDQVLAAAFGRAARSAGVGRIVYLGGLGETGAGLSEHLRSRRNVESALAAAGVPVTTLRAAMIIGAGSASFEILRYLVERLPVMITPRWVETRCQPIAVQDALRYLVDAAESPATAGRTLDIGGPEVLSYREILDLVAEELGLRRRWILPVPVLTPRLSSLWIHLVTPISAAIARPLAEGLRNPVVCRDREALRLMPGQPLGVREAVRAALGKGPAQEVETRWSDAGPMPGDPDWAGGRVFTERLTADLDAGPAATFAAVCRLGGGHGWYAADFLWRLRGFLDRLAGGPGLRRGRRHPSTLRYGDALDFWRVTAIEPERRLELRAEMKLPGEASLEFLIQPIESAGGRPRSHLAQIARFKPKGLLGLAYWYAVLPFHGMVFRSLLRGIEREACGVGQAAGP
jgi:uncharacterized protein YbjT (DUF2867 family)